jgi:hypothetical protein
LIGKALEINAEQWGKDNHSTLTSKKNTKNIYLQSIAEDVVNMNPEVFVQKFSELTNTWESILCQNKRVLEEIFFVMHILEDEFQSIEDNIINDHLSSWLLNEIMNPKMQKLRKKLKKKIFFLVFKIPKSQIERGDKGIIVRHIDAHCII